MSLDKDRWGTGIFNAVMSLGITAGAPITNDQLKQVWQKVAEASKSEINENAGIDLPAGDIPVPALGLTFSGAPVAGQALSGPTGEKIGRIK